MTYEDQSQNINIARFLLILSLPLTFFTFLILAFYKLIPLQVEIHTLITNFFILLIFLFFIKHNAWYSYDKFIYKFNLKNQNIDEFIKNNEITIAGKSKSLSPLDHFFHDDLNELRNDHFASIASSIFPTLGILGTFVAIAISMPDFTSSSQEALDKEISTLLAGVGTAFYASIYGIFLSLWWTFFEKRALSKIEKKILISEKKYQNKVWSKEEIEILSLIQNKKNTDILLNNIQQMISPQYVSKLDEISKNKIDEIKNINLEHKKIEELLFSKYDLFASILEKNSKKEEEFYNNLNQIEEKINQTNLKLNSRIEEQNKFSKALKAEIYAVLTSFELISSDLKHLGEKLIKESFKNEKE